MKTNLIKTKFKALIIGAILALAPSVSFAGQWTGFYPVYEVYTHSGGYLFLKLNPVASHVNPDDCISTSLIRFEPDKTNFKEIYQMLLTAQASGLKVDLYIVGCSGNYPTAAHVRTRQ